MQDRFDKKMAMVITMDMTMLTTMRIAMMMIREEDKTHTFSILFLGVISLFGPLEAQFFYHPEFSFKPSLTPHREEQYTPSSLDCLIR